MGDQLDQKQIHKPTNTFKLGEKRKDRQKFIDTFKRLDDTTIALESVSSMNALMQEKDSKWIFNIGGTGLFTDAKMAVTRYHELVSQIPTMTVKISKNDCMTMAKNLQNQITLVMEKTDKYLQKRANPKTEDGKRRYKLMEGSYNEANDTNLVLERLQNKIFEMKDNEMIDFKELYFGDVCQPLQTYKEEMKENDVEEKDNETEEVFLDRTATRQTDADLIKRQQHEFLQQNIKRDMEHLKEIGAEATGDMKTILDLISEYASYDADAQRSNSYKSTMNKNLWKLCSLLDKKEYMNDNLMHKYASYFINMTGYPSQNFTTVAQNNKNWENQTPENTIVHHDSDYDGEKILEDNAERKAFNFMTTVFSIKDQPLFISQVTGHDSKQFGVGDCYFQAGISSVMSKDPQAIKNMIRDNGDGTVTVRFYQPKTIEKESMQNEGKKRYLRTNNLKGSSDVDLITKLLLTKTKAKSEQKRDKNVSLDVKEYLKEKVKKDHPDLYDKDKKVDEMTKIIKEKSVGSYPVDNANKIMMIRMYDASLETTEEKRKELEAFKEKNKAKVEDIEKRRQEYLDAREYYSNEREKANYRLAVQKQEAKIKEAKEKDPNADVSRYEKDKAKFEKILKTAESKSLEKPKDITEDDVELFTAYNKIESDLQSNKSYAESHKKTDSPTSAANALGDDPADELALDAFNEILINGEEGFNLTDVKSLAKILAEDERFKPVLDGMKKALAKSKGRDNYSEVIKTGLDALYSMDKATYTAIYTDHYKEINKSREKKLNDCHMDIPWEKISAENDSIEKAQNEEVEEVFVTVDKTVTKSVTSIIGHFDVGGYNFGSNAVMLIQKAFAYSGIRTNEFSKISENDNELKKYLSRDILSYENQLKGEFRPVVLGENNGQLRNELNGLKAELKEAETEKEKEKIKAKIAKVENKIAKKIDEKLKGKYDDETMGVSWETRQKLEKDVRKEAKKMGWNEAEIAEELGKRLNANFSRIQGGFSGEAMKYITGKNYKTEDFNEQKVTGKNASEIIAGYGESLQGKMSYIGMENFKTIGRTGVVDSKNAIAKEIAIRDSISQFIVGAVSTEIMKNTLNLNDEGKKALKILDNSELVEKTKMILSKKSKEGYKLTEEEKAIEESLKKENPHMITSIQDVYSNAALTKATRTITIEDYYDTLINADKIVYKSPKECPMFADHRYSNIQKKLKFPITAIDLIVAIAKDKMDVDVTNDRMFKRVLKEEAIALQKHVESLEGVNIEHKAFAGTDKEGVYTKRADNFFDDILIRLHNKESIGCGTISFSSKVGGVNAEHRADSCLEGHAYSIVDAFMKNGRKYITVRNPWGCDGKKVIRKVKNGKVTYDYKDMTGFMSIFSRAGMQYDGTYSIELNDFMAKFSDVTRLEKKIV